MPFNYLERFLGVRLSPLFSQRAGLEESSGGNFHKNFNNSGMTGTTVKSKGTSDGHSHPVLIPKVNNLLIGSGFQPQPLVEGSMLKLVASQTSCRGTVSESGLHYLRCNKTRSSQSL